MKKLTSLVLAVASFAPSAPIVRSGVTVAGAADPLFLNVINAFRSDLGALNTGACSPAPCTSGRREINWDGVPGPASSPNAFPGNFFNGTMGVEAAGRLRGATFSTPGTGFRVSDTKFAAEATFNSAAEFGVFSPAKLFASLGSPITDVTFSVPGSPGTGATVSGFGVVFTDVDYTGSASIEFFDAWGMSLGLYTVPGVFPVPSGNSQGSFSFLGVSFDAGERVARVRITSGSHGVDGNYVGNDDAVVMDDFIYGEPLAAAVPEPVSVLLISGGLAALGMLRRARR